ncbi:hypothetical protein SAMN05444483_10893 [Salegentibacter echinorum]|uniref:Uncharacterized protein n=1 Tax=Salegentibacter echinorum TaxID=1073325 RepID=A0A1M5IQP4_SALEC|nr:hypothetical protein SAMN05444483_10893 [Salegentibacter echinorum]
MQILFNLDPTNHINFRLKIAQKKLNKKTYKNVGY